MCGEKHILMIWIGGFVLAVALYLIGPDRFFDACLDFIDSIDDGFPRSGRWRWGHRPMASSGPLPSRSMSCSRCWRVLASQRGHRGFWALIVVSATFMMLVWRPYAVYPTPISRWIGALVLVVIAAIVMTQRLTGAAAPPQRTIAALSAGAARYESEHVGAGRRVTAAAGLPRLSWPCC